MWRFAYEVMPPTLQGRHARAVRACVSCAHARTCGASLGCMHVGCRVWVGVAARLGSRHVCFNPAGTQDLEALLVAPCVGAAAVSAPSRASTNPYLHVYKA